MGRMHNETQRYKNYLFIHHIDMRKKTKHDHPPPSPQVKPAMQWLYNPGVNLLPDNLPLPVICA